MAELITLFLPPVANILMLALLVYYRINKKFKKARDGFWAFLDHNLVEIIFGAVLVPDMWGQIAKLIP